MANNQVNQSEIAKLIKKHGGVTKFSRKMNIPLPTVRSWYYTDVRPSSWVMKLLAAKLEDEMSCTIHGIVDSINNLTIVVTKELNYAYMTLVDAYNEDGKLAVYILSEDGKCVDRYRYQQQWRQVKESITIAELIEEIEGLKNAVKL